MRCALLRVADAYIPLLRRLPPLLGVALNQLSFSRSFPFQTYMHIHHPRPHTRTHTPRQTASEVHSDTVERTPSRAKRVALVASVNSGDDSMT